MFLVRLLRPELLTAAICPPAFLSSLNLADAELPSVFALKVISKNDIVMRNRVRPPLARALLVVADVPRR